MSAGSNYAIWKGAKFYYDASPTANGTLTDITHLVRKCNEWNKVVNQVEETTPFGVPAPTKDYTGFYTVEAIEIEGRWFTDSNASAVTPDMLWGNTSFIGPAPGAPSREFKMVLVANTEANTATSREFSIKTLVAEYIPKPPAETSQSGQFYLKLEPTGNLTSTMLTEA